MFSLLYFSQTLCHNAKCLQEYNQIEFQLKQINFLGF